MTGRLVDDKVHPVIRQRSLYAKQTKTHKRNGEIKIVNNDDNNDASTTLPCC